MPLKILDSRFHGNDIGELNQCFPRVDDVGEEFWIGERGDEVERRKAVPMPFHPSRIHSFTFQDFRLVWPGLLVL
jgi:hypothetical protein